MEYEFENERSWVAPLLIVLALLLTFGGIVVFILKGGKSQPNPIQTAAEAAQSTTHPIKGTTPTLDLPAGERKSSPSSTLESTSQKLSATTPQLLVEQLISKLTNGDASQFTDFLNEESQQALLATAQTASAPLIREIGELDFQRRKRFQAEYETSPVSLLTLETERNDNGQWLLSKAAFQPASSTTETSIVADPTTSVAFSNDSLTTADHFLQAALQQNFPLAKSYVSPSVSDTTIAAMCILFEEGEYRLNPKKPLRAMVNREQAATFLANVLTTDSSKPAQFGINLKHNDATWTITEINLDSLLADYAQRVSGGDVHYSPLISNPQGGETLAIFFEFDEERLVNRTRRQLQIVADVLRTNTQRRLTVSGHTDALGSDDYNRELSSHRAESVRDYLISQGVGASQIVIKAEGESRPRRPNETETGDDNPTGRRANRRTEIFLDFKDS